MIVTYSQCWSISSALGFVLGDGFPQIAACRLIGFVTQRAHFSKNLGEDSV
jgi:hypothetical protein